MHPSAPVPANIMSESTINAALAAIGHADAARFCTDARAFCRDHGGRWGDDLARVVGQPVVAIPWDDPEWLRFCKAVIEEAEIRAAMNDPTALAWNSWAESLATFVALSVDYGTE